MRAAKVQASLRIRAVSPEPSLLAHTNSESRGTFRQKARSLAPLNGWACAVKICHDGMLEDTNSLGGAQLTRDLKCAKRESCATVICRCMLAVSHHEIRKTRQSSAILSRRQITMAIFTFKYGKSTVIDENCKCRKKIIGYNRVKTTSTGLIPFHLFVLSVVCKVAVDLGLRLSVEQ